MKELSIEEKAKYYDKAIERAKTKLTDEVAYSIFPELRESEDERIRKKLIEAVKEDMVVGGTKDKQLAIAWLEKQGEQKNITLDDFQNAFEKKAKQYEIHLPNRGYDIHALCEELYNLMTNTVQIEEKIKPKYKVGDKIQYFNGSGTIMTIEKIENGEYLFANPFGRISIKEGNNWHLVNIVEQKPADKVEPKFEIKEGKWYVCIRDLLDNYANKAFCKGDIYLSTQNGSLIPSNSNVPFEVVCPDTYFKDWTIHDAKAGDILSYRNGQWIFILKEIENNSSIIEYYILLSEKGLEIKNMASTSLISSILPATKEQRDLLFQKMREAGYEWNAKKKELKKIEQKATQFTPEQADILDKHIDKFVEHNAWSEEDKFCIQALLHYCEKYQIKDSDRLRCLNWLKFLKDRVQLQPQQEWTKEDKERYISCLQKLGTGNPEQPETINSKWFKEHVYLQTQWRPSDEQMEVLKLSTYCPSERMSKVLFGLYQDLKKLKE